MRVQIRDVYKSFGELEVFKGLSLEIESGKVTVIVGGSGAGKSVLLKHIVGLLRPDSGSIMVDGVDVTKLKETDLLPLRRRIGMVFQTGGLLASLTVYENVALPLVEHRLFPRREVRRVVMEKLKLLGLEDKANAYPSSLSGGMIKRVSIARVLAFNPEMILYDEPTAGLDPPMAENIDNLIIDLNRRLGVTSVVVTHDLHSVFFVADRIMMLHGGVIIFSGTSEEFMHSEDEVIRSFLHRLSLSEKF